MKALNEMKLQFQSRSVNEAFGRTAVIAFIAQLDPAMDELADLKTAVSEAITNCVVHAYKEKLDTIYISSQIFENNKVVIKIRDRGCGIPDIAKAMEPLYTSCDSGERAGLGFAVMESCVDKLRVLSKENKGTTVILQRKIKSKGA